MIFLYDRSEIEPRINELNLTFAATFPLELQEIADKAQGQKLTLDSSDGKPLKDHLKEPVYPPDVSPLRPVAWAPFDADEPVGKGILIHVDSHLEIFGLVLDRRPTQVREISLECQGYDVPCSPEKMILGFALAT
jgi:hypothetical protein